MLCKNGLFAGCMHALASAGLVVYVDQIMKVSGVEILV
jgi:hypothetical protein